MSLNTTGTSMLDNLPNDSDGDALRRLVADGSDITKPMEIDFAMDVPDANAGNAFAAIARMNGFKASVSRDNDTKEWTCYCSREMVPSYDAMIAVQKTLEDLGRPYAAKPDGWGSFGNAPE